MITVLVCGGRAYDDWGRVLEVLDKIGSDNGNVRIIHGGCGYDPAAKEDGWRRYRGADALAHRWAELRGHEAKAYPADWQAHGKSAGPIRNAKMLELDHPQLVVAFPGGDGTRDMVQKARRARVALIVVEDRR